MEESLRRDRKQISRTSIIGDQVRQLGFRRDALRRKASEEAGACGGGCNLGGCTRDQVRGNRIA